VKSLDDVGSTVQLEDVSDFLVVRYFGSVACCYVRVAVDDVNDLLVARLVRHFG